MASLVCQPNNLSNRLRLQWGRRNLASRWSTLAIPQDVTIPMLHISVNGFLFNIGANALGDAALPAEGMRTGVVTLNGVIVDQETGEIKGTAGNLEGEDLTAQHGFSFDVPSDHDVNDEPFTRYQYLVHMILDVSGGGGEDPTDTTSVTGDLRVFMTEVKYEWEYENGIPGLVEPGTPKTSILVDPVPPSQFHSIEVDMSVESHLHNS